LKKRLPLATALAALAFTLGFAPRAATGNPLSLARFTGVYGDPMNDGAFAIYWNPAGLARPGFDLVVEGQLLARQASYDRDATLNHTPPDLQAANTGLATITTVGVAPGVAGRIGWRLPHFDLGLALGAFVETGGAAAWDKNLSAPTQYPGAIDGPQRWASISSSLLAIDVGAGIALKHRASGLSLGFSPLLVNANFSTVRARNIDRSEDLLDSAGNNKEGRALFNGSANAFSAIVGVRWDIARRFAIGATYQRGATFHLDGKLQVAFGTQPASSQDAYLVLPVADTVKVSALLPIASWLTLRPTFEWAHWSVLQQHVFASAVDNSALLIVERDFGDDYAGRLRADAWLHPRLKISLGGTIEKGPTPLKTMEPGFGETNSFQVEAGAKLQISHHVDLVASFTFQYFPTVVVANSVQQPTTNGTYNDQREFFVVDLEFHGWHETVE
jgi:long-chain fatty acid transport protein